MNERDDVLARAKARLQALRNSIDRLSYGVEEKYVREFHVAFQSLSSIGIDASEFFIPDSEIVPRVRSSNYLTGETTYSREKYVDQAFVIAKLDAVLGYLDALGPKGNSRSHTERVARYPVIPQTEVSDGAHYDVFLSYSGIDEQSARALWERMQASRFRVYFAKKSLQAGDSFSEEIRQALIHSTELWVLITPNSLSSEWVTTEWGAGWALGKRIVPILLRCERQQLPDRLRALHCIDYHDHERAVEQLSERIGHRTSQ